jgi:hypothetical protein
MRDKEKPDPVPLDEMLVGPRSPVPTTAVLPLSVSFKKLETTHGPRQPFNGNYVVRRRGDVAPRRVTSRAAVRWTYTLEQSVGGLL